MFLKISFEVDTYFFLDVLILCVCIPYACIAPRGQKEGVGFCGTGVTDGCDGAPIGAGNLDCVFCKSNKHPNHGAISLGSGLYIFNNQHSSLAQ